jgi:hypothetical protein
LIGHLNTLENLWSPRGSSIGWGPCLMKQRSLVRILPPSCVDMSKKKKKRKEKKIYGAI